MSDSQVQPTSVDLSSPSSCSQKISQASVRSNSRSRSDTRSCSVENPGRRGRERRRKRSRSRSHSRIGSRQSTRSSLKYRRKSRSRSRSRTIYRIRRSPLRTRSRSRSERKSRRSRKSRSRSKSKSDHKRRSSRSRSKSRSDHKRRSSRSKRHKSSKSKRNSSGSRDLEKQKSSTTGAVESDSSISVISNTNTSQSKSENQKIILVVNISQHATSKQVESLFKYCGRIKDFVLYPIVDMPIPLYEAKIAFIKFARSSSVNVALHLMRTMFLDKSIFTMKFITDEINCSKIPDEYDKVVQSLLAGNNTELVTKMIEASYQQPNSLSVIRASDSPHTDADVVVDSDKNEINESGEFSVGIPDISTDMDICIDLIKNESGNIVFSDGKPVDPVLHESEVMLSNQPEEKSTKLFGIYDYEDLLQPFDFTNGEETS